MKPSLILLYSLAAVTGMSLYFARNPQPTTCCQADDGAPWRVLIVEPNSQGQLAARDVLSWEDSMGYVQSDGTFQAPPHTTLDVDEVTGLTRSGETITVWVRVDSRTAPARTTSVPSWFLDSEQLAQHSTHDKLNQALTQWQGWLASDEASTELAVGGVQPTQLPGKEVPMSNNGNQYLIPSYVEGFPHDGVTFTPQPTNLYAQWFPKLKELGLWEDLPKRCREGEIAVRRSSWYNTVQKSPTWNEIGSLTITFSAEQSVNIDKIFGLSFKEGTTWTGTVRTRSLEYTKYQIVESYKCLGGKWKLMERNRCYQIATGIETIPLWYCITQGYPPYGAPNKYSDLMCKPIAFK